MKVFKYDVEINDIFTVKLPKGAQVLRVDKQGDWFFMWALVDPERETEERIFRFAGTGHEINFDYNQIKYINTFFTNEGRFVWHIFEILK